MEFRIKATNKISGNEFTMKVTASNEFQARQIVARKNKYNDIISVEAINPPQEVFSPAFPNEPDWM